MEKISWLDKVTNEKKMLAEMQTLRAGCSIYKAEPKIFAPSQTPSLGRRRAKI